MSKEYSISLDKKTNEELITILYFEKQKYNNESIEYVKGLIKERQITKEEINKLKKEIRKKINKEKNKLREESDQNRGCLGFIIDLFLQG